MQLGISVLERTGRSSRGCGDQSPASEQLADGCGYLDRRNFHIACTAFYANTRVGKTVFNDDRRCGSRRLVAAVSLYRSFTSAYKVLIASSTNFLLSSSVPSS